jgi:diguanylate cyclase (GGDEF)-like protein
MKEDIYLQKSVTEYKRFCDLFSEMSVSMGSILYIDKLISYFVNKIAELFRVNRVSFMLLDEAKQELSLQSSRGLDLKGDEIKIKLGEAFGGWVAKDGKPLLVKDVEAEFPELSKNRISRYATKSFIIVPVKIKDEVAGILNITDKKDKGEFSDDDLKIITLVSKYLALYIENLRLLEKNNNLSITDPLTNLFNHRYFQEQLLEEIYRAERYKHPLSLLMLDIDNFRQYNQTQGYSIGDSALKQIAIAIKENTRKVDIACRYGPEEFAIILPEINVKKAFLVAEKLREKIATAVFARDRESSFEITRLTVSIGVVGYRVGTNKEELIRRVESALVEAKQKGKNRVIVYRKPWKLGSILE